jgi:3-oxoacyl-[acyl-carrier protein] reductase
VQLTGRTALVTAGARNLGAAICRALAEDGANVVVNFRTSIGPARALVADLHELGAGSHVAVGGDVADPDGALRVTGEAMEWAGGVDILVNNAGPYDSTPYLELAEADWDRVWDTNVASIYRCVRAVVPAMRSRGWGRIVNLSAVSAHVRNRSIYGLAKSSVEVLTEQLALELGPEITVNAVAPGQIRESLDEMLGIDPEWAAAVTARTPLQRLPTRREVAELVVLLCSPTFDVVTGTTIPVDGGLRLPRF